MMLYIPLKQSANYLSALFLVYHNFILAMAQCPNTIKSPCECGSTRYEPVAIVCSNAQNLEMILQGVGEPPTVIDSLVIANTPIGTLPAFAFSGLAIKRLVLRNNDLVSIHPDAFDQPITQTLMELEIRNNPLLGTVPKSGLSLLVALRSLVLAKDGIQKVDSNNFLGYECRSILRRLDLSGNGITMIEEGAFNGLVSLEELSLDKNQLQVIPTAALAPLGATLRDLSLGVNKIAVLPAGSLPLAGLQSLSLEANMLESISSDAFMSTPNLLYLYLSANRFTRIDPQMFFNIPALRVLSLSDNIYLDRIQSNTFQYVPDIVRLEISACAIESIELGVFQNLPNVQVLVLGYNKIKRIPRSMFQDLTKLVSLDLKGNHIEEIEREAFSRLPDMKHLDLSNNQLATLNADAFRGTFERTQPVTSRMLYLYDNPWVCDLRLNSLRNWLRSNPEMIIDAPGKEPTKCAEPITMRGTMLRQPKAIASTPIYPSITNTPTQGQQVSGTDSNDITLQVAGNAPSKGLGVAAVILGIILGIFLLSLVLLMIVRYFVAKNHKQKKREMDELRQFAASASTASGYPPSMYTAAIPHATTAASGSYPADTVMQPVSMSVPDDRYGPMGVVNPAVEMFDERYEGAENSNGDHRRAIGYRGIISGTLSRGTTPTPAPRHRLSHNENNVDEVTIQEGFYNDVGPPRQNGHHQRAGLSGRQRYWWF